MKAVPGIGEQGCESEIRKRKRVKTSLATLLGTVAAEVYSHAAQVVFQLLSVCGVYRDFDDAFLCFCA